MSRRLALRAATLVAPLLVLAGCSKTGDIDFSLTQTVHPDTQGGTTYSDVAQVDLAAQAPDAWDHRDKLKSLDLVDITGTISAVTVGAGTTGGGSISLRPDGATGTTSDVLVGTWVDEPVTAGTTLAISLTDTTLQIINDALKGNGRFAVVVSGSTAAAAAFTADLTLHLKMTYKISVP